MGERTMPPFQRRGSNFYTEVQTTYRTRNPFGPIKLLLIFTCRGLTNKPDTATFPLVRYNPRPPPYILCRLSQHALGIRLLVNIKRRRTANARLPVQLPLGTRIFIFCADDTTTLPALAYKWPKATLRHTYLYYKSSISAI